MTRVDAPDQEWQVVSCSKGGVPGDQNRTAARGLEVTGDFFGRRRQVVVYRDVASADAALTGLITRLDACAAGQGDAGAQPMDWTSDALPGLGTPGETGWRAMTGSSTADGSHPFYVELFATRVGRAVVVSGRGQSDPFAAADSLKDSHGRVVEAMCRYTDDNCASVDRDLGTDPLRDLYVPREGEQQTRHVTEIPDHIDLSEGLAADDVETVRASSSRLDEPWFYDPCHAQGRARDEGRSDFRSEAASGPEHSEFRQLAIYPSADAAEKVLASWFVGSLLDCDIYRYDDGTSEDHWDALDQGWVPADEAFVYVSESWSDGTRTTRATVYVIARLGNAILVVGEDGELGATDTSVQATVQDLKPYVTDVLTQQLCGFADGGSC